MGIVDFPTRISHITATAIDNIFIDITSYEDYQVIPFINDLSDHDAQLLTIKIQVHNQADRLKTTRNVNKHTILDFICKLSFESWDGVFNSTEVNIMFNSILNTYLRLFYSSFPLLRITKIIGLLQELKHHVNVKENYFY